MNSKWQKGIERFHVLDSRIWAFIVLAVLASMPFMLDNYSLSLMARLIALGLLAVSVGLMTGFAGLPTMGQVAPFAVGAYMTVNLTQAHITQGPVLLVASGLAAAVFCAVIGVAVVRTRGVVVLMVTLAVGELTTVAADQWKSITGGSDGSGRIDATQAWWGGEPMLDDGVVYWYCLAAAAVVVLTTVWVLRRQPGKLLRGVRDNETRMRASGHRVTWYLLVGYVAAGAIAGIGGSLLATSQRQITPSDVGFEVSALMLMAVVIGGSVSLFGALIGVALVVTLQDWASLEAPGQGPLLLGVLFIASVFLLPNGLAGLLSRVLRPLRSKEAA